MRERRRWFLNQSRSPRSPTAPPNFNPTSYADQPSSFLIGCSNKSSAAPPPLLHLYFTSSPSIGHRLRSYHHLHRQPVVLVTEVQCDSLLPSGLRCPHLELTLRALTSFTSDTTRGNGSHHHQHAFLTKQ